MLISVNEIQEWKQHEITQEFFKALKRSREFLKENLIRGNFENEDFVKGKAGALQDLLGMTVEEIQEMMNDEQ